MDSDLEKIRKLGAGTVRIFLEPDVYGYPYPSQQDLAYLDETLAKINAHGLRAHVNLFDCWGDWHDIRGSLTWLASVMGAHRGDQRIAVWELRNEVPLDQPAARDWLKAVFPNFKAQAAGAMTTVSVTSPEWLNDVRSLTYPNPPDIYSLHWYMSGPSEVEDLSKAVERAHQVLGGARLSLGEFGFSTYDWSDADQANFYRDTLYAADREGIADIGVWTLNDFPQGTNRCGDSASSEQLGFGLYRLDGSPKPAVSVLQQAFHGSFPKAPSEPDVVNSSFEETNPRTGRLDDWRSWDPDWSGQQWFMQDCAMAHSGQCSARVYGPGQLQVGVYSARNLHIVFGHSYGLAGFVRTENLEGWAQIVLAWFSSSGEWLGNTASQSVDLSTSTQWLSLHVDPVRPPPAATSLQVYGEMYSADPQTHVWFDDLVLQVVPAPEPAAGS